MMQEMGDTPRTLFVSARKFMSGTVLSRFAGLLREMVMAYVFGADAAVGAFYVAFRWANFFRRFFGEGSMLSGFVPHYEKVRSRGAAASSAFVQDLCWILLFFFAPFLLILEGGLYYASQQTDWSEILSLTMVMLPSLFFLSLHTIGSALLQCEKRFFLPAFSPVALNFTWIGVVILLRRVSPSEAMPWLAGGIFLGYVIQWAMVWPSAWRASVTSWRFPSLGNRDVWEMLPTFSLSLVGVGAVQINSAVDVLFARWASPEGPAYLNYALRMQQLPIGLFAIAISSALLPPLSRAWREGAVDRFCELFQQGCEKTFLLILPCAFACLVMGVSSTSLLYGRGHFDQKALIGTATCLWGYGAGLLPISIGLLLAPLYYAQHDFRTPTVAALLSVGSNCLLNAFFLFYWDWGAEGIAFSTSLAAVIQSMILWRRVPSVIRQRLALIPSVIPPFLFSLAASLAVWILLRYTGGKHLFDLSGPFSMQLSVQIGDFLMRFLPFFATYGILFFFWKKQKKTLPVLLK